MNVKAFSLVELMVVIAIVALLAAVAVPSYREYAGRASMTAVYNLLQNQMDYVAQQYSQGSTTAKTLTSPVTGVTSIVATPTSTGGTVQINFAAGSTFSSNFGTATVVGYTASETNGVLSWVCNAATPTATNGITGGASTTTRQAVRDQFFPACSAI